LAPTSISLDPAPCPRNFASTTGAAQAVENNLTLVFYAFSREVSALKRRLKNRVPLKLKSLNGFRAITAAGEIAFIATGLGTRRSREVVARALSEFPQTDFIIGTGIAGALSGGLRPGDIVIADRLVRTREDSLHPEHVIPVDRQTIDYCERVMQAAGLEFSTGAILTSRGVLPDAESKRLAKKESGAIAVDMESVAIAFAATSRGIPFAVVRTVMDSLEDEIFGAEVADEEGRVRPLAAANYLVHNPAAFLKMPRMLRNLALATRSLADAIEALSLAGPPF
jgi:nucleoside phosphorylase